MVLDSRMTDDRAGQLIRALPAGRYILRIKFLREGEDGNFSEGENGGGLLRLNLILSGQSSRLLLKLIIRPTKELWMELINCSSKMLTLSVL